jgi:negative regulator of flagellin synthesis FlgM
MKIDHSAINPLSTNKAGDIYSADKKSRKAGTANSMAKADRAELSEKARILAKARVAFSEAGVEENARVAELKREIEAGTYQVPIEKLAEKMLAREE